MVSSTSAYAGPGSTPTPCVSRGDGNAPRRTDTLAGTRGSGAPGELAKGRGCKSPVTKE